MFFTVTTMRWRHCSPRPRSIRPLLKAMSYCSVVVAMFALNLLPNLAIASTYPVAAIRGENELDVGLRLIQMLTPFPVRGWFTEASAKLSGGYPSEPHQYFGFVTAVALLLMLGWLAIVVVRPDRSSRTDVRPLLGCLTVAWILIATTGGLGWFVTLIDFSQIRAWNRVSILLMFISLAWLALTVGPRIRRWATESAVPRPIIIVLALAVLLFGLADQSSAVPATLYVDSCQRQGVLAAVDGSYRSGDGLPVAADDFRIAALFSSSDYDLLRPYLQTQSLAGATGE
jgi:hypothetical protein